MRTTFIGLVILFFTCFQQSFGQSFTARVSQKVIGKKDVLQVEYIAQDATISEFVPPPFINWNVVGGPDISSSQVQTNNVVHSETIYALTLQPRTTGKLIVPAAIAKVNGVRKNTNSVIVEVRPQDHIAGATPRPQNPLGPLMSQPAAPKAEFGGDQFLRKGEDPRDKIKNNLLVKLQVNKRSFVVGEPILVTYKLFTRLRSQSRVVSQPAFTGCTVIEMTTDNPAPSRESVNGKMYNVYVIRQVQLFPLQEGKLLLPEASVENKVAFYDASGINYRDLYYNQRNLPVQEQTVTLKSEPVVIDIKPLPPLPTVGPLEFSGAVGNFDIAAAPAVSALSTNNTNELIVEIAGEGNLQEVKAPTIQWPNGVEGFASTLKSQEDKNYFPMRARKRFTYPFVVSNPGAYTIPPIVFTYYDASAGKYISKRTAPITLQVAKGTGDKNVLSTPATNDGFNMRLAIIIGAALIGIVIGLIWYNGRNKPKAVAVPQAPVEPAVAIETAESDASKYLFNIRELWPEENSSAFYKKLCHNIHGFIEEKYKIAPGQLPSYIQQQQGDVTDLQTLQSLLDHCTLGMYTPVYTMAEAIQHRLLAIEVLTRLDKKTV